MPATIIQGVGWGDEGKGQQAYREAQYADVCVRLQGSANAGNTVWHEGKKYALHMLPPSIFNPQCVSVCSSYELIDLEALMTDLDIADSHGAQVMLDPNSTLVLPIHKQIDAAREDSLGNAKVGTTCRGNGPAYEDLTSRRGLTLGDLRDLCKATSKLTKGRYYAERYAVLKYHWPDADVMAILDLIEWLAQFRDRVLPHLGDTAKLVRQTHAADKHVLGFVAHGRSLDLTQSSRHKTSSMGSPGIFTHLYGIVPGRVIAVAKAFMTRVGAGPFPTEMEEGEAKEFREANGEFGTTTARPRRIGHADAVLYRENCRRINATELVLTKLDALCNRHPYICYDYVLPGVHPDGSVTTVDAHETLTDDLLAKITPAYDKDIRPWSWRTTPTNARELPLPVYAYLRLLEYYVGVPISRVSVGPELQHTIFYAKSGK